MLIFYTDNSFQFFHRRYKSSYGGYIICGSKDHWPGEHLIGASSPDPGELAGMAEWTWWSLAFGFLALDYSFSLVYVRSPMPLVFDSTILPPLLC